MKPDPADSSVFDDVGQGWNNESSNDIHQKRNPHHNKTMLKLNTLDFKDLGNKQKSKKEQSEQVLNQIMNTKNNGVSLTANNFIQSRVMLHLQK